MSAHKYSSKILPRYVDSDIEVRYIKTNEGAVRYMSNIRIGKRSEKTKGASINIRGTLFVPNNYLPVGENECIGSVTNETNSFLIFFNWNSNDEHGIYIYNPKFEEPIQLLYKDSAANIFLGFHRYFRIKGTKAKIIQDEHLFWTDAYNSPRYLNIKWALDYKKKKIWEIQQIDADIVDHNVFSFKYKGTTVNLFVSNTTSILTSNPLLSTYFEIEDCSCSIKLTEKEDNTCEIFALNTTIRIVPQNFYPKIHNERQIDLVCYPQPIAPKVVLRKNLKQRRNLLGGFTWQFRIKIVYFDNNESVWSSWSKLVNTSGGCEEEYNYINIDYTDPIFDCYNDINQLHLIKSVVIGYRNTNQGNLHSFVTVKQCDIPKGIQSYDFYNDISASAEPEYDDKLKQYDTVPLQCGVLSSSDNRLLVGDVTENYEEGCFDFDVKVEYHPKDANEKYNGKASCWIDINTLPANPIGQAPYENVNFPITQLTENANTYYFGSGFVTLAPYGSNETVLNADILDKYDQRLGTPGFVVYLAGTDNFVISKQVISTATGVDVNISNVENDANVIRGITNNDKEKVFDSVKNNSKAFRQRAEFTGLKDGTYIMRIASHWCSYGNKLGKGDAYDLDNGLVWQKTSTNVYSVNGEKYVFEAVVTIVNGVMQQTEPVFVIADVAYFFETPPQQQLDTTFIQAYVSDSESISQSDVYEGARIEHCSVKITTMVQLSDIIRSIDFSITDHNGYWFKLVNQGTLFIEVSKGKNIGVGLPGPLFADWQNLIGNEGDMSILNRGDDIFIGNLTELKNGTCDTISNNIDHFYTEYALTNLIIPYANGGHNITKNFRTLVKGRITNLDGYPIPNVLVVATGTNRIDTTDINGNFGIIVYANSNIRSDRRTVDLIFSGDECNNIGFSLGKIITLGKEAPPKFNDTYPYVIDDIKIDVQYLDLVPVYYLKNGDTYDFGATLMDRALRKTTVLHSDKKNRIKLPFTTEYVRDYFPEITTDTLGNIVTPTTKADGFFTVKIIPITRPPIWAVSVFWLRTEGQVYADYVHMVVSDVKYIINYKETLNVDTGVMEPDPVTTTYANKDANEIYLDLISSFTEYKDRNSNSKKGWIFEKGDRMRFIYKEDGELFEFVEVEIKEQRGNYFVIDNIDALGELKLGFVVELFRFKTKVTDKRYFEIGEYIKVLNPYTEQRSWELNSISLNTGDAYRRVRKMIAKFEDERIIASRLIEDPTPDDTLLEKDNDIGRSDFINSQYKQIRRLGTIRCGDTILTDSNINKIRRFDAEQQFTSDNNNGAITVIDDFKNVIFVAQESKCHTRYIGKTALRIGDGNVALSDKNTILSEPDYLVDNYGCTNPESYTRCDNFGIFYDSIHGNVAAYFPQNGLNNLSGYDERYQTSKLQDSVFIKLGNDLRNIPKELYSFLVSIQSVFNKNVNEANISIAPIVIDKGQDISAFSGTRLNSNIGENDVKFKTYDKSPISLNLRGFTVCYDTEIKMWLLERSYNPTAYGTINNDVVAFVNGNLHLMEYGDANSFNNFFGTKYKSVIDVVMNEANSDLKCFKNWSVESNKLWSNPYVRVDNSRAFRDIESKTPTAKIIKRQGVFYAPFMFDINTPNIQNPLISGNPLVGETLLMRLENDDTDEVILYAVNIFADYVARSNY